jgi:hypothetical protein
MEFILFIILYFIEVPNYHYIFFTKLINISPRNFRKMRHSTNSTVLMPSKFTLKKITTNKNNSLKKLAHTQSFLNLLNNLNQKPKRSTVYL